MMNKIPLFVVTGFLASGKTSFINGILSSTHNRSKRIAVVQFEEGENSLDHSKNSSMLYISKYKLNNCSSQEIVKELYMFLKKSNPDELWLEWNGITDINKLLDILSYKILNRLVLQKVIQLADAENYTMLLSQTGGKVFQQLAMADMLILPNASRKQYSELLKTVQTINTDIVVRKSFGFSQSDVYKVKKKKYHIWLLLLLLVFMIIGMLNENFYMEAVPIFIGTWLQAIPFLFIGILLSSVIQVFMPYDFFDRFFPKSNFLGILFGVIAGFFLPVCDCASIPVFRSLVKKNVPLPAAIAFMLSSPVINPVVMLSTYYAYGGNIKVVVARVGLGIICSVIIGLCFMKYKEKVIILSSGFDRICYCGCQNMDYDDKSRLRRFLYHSQAEFYEVGKFLVIGIGVSTIFQTIMNRSEMVNNSGTIFSIFIMMVLAFLLSLCSSSDAIIGKTLGSNLSFGGVMGFMVFGPMLDVKNMILMTSSFSKKFILRLSLIVFVVCFIVILVASLVGLEAIVL